VAFFDFVARGLEDLDLHRLLAERPFQFANAELRRAELTGGDHIFIRRRRRPTPAIDQVLPPPHHRLIDP
jgi:hypothetical protein